MLEAARDKGNLNVRRIVTLALAENHEETDEAVELTQKLLHPILDQCERVRHARKGRRPLQDVDPETDEEIPEEEAAA